MELKSKYLHIKNTNQVYKSVLSRSERMASWVTEKVGSTGFFLLLFFWTLLWLSWNVLAPVQYRFDPFPAFSIWLYISNLIQIFLMPLVMIGQNLQGKHTEIRAENDYEINMKSEKEITEIKQELEEIKGLLKEYLASKK